MQTQIITKRDDIVVRRLVLEPGEVMPWHRDTCHRFSVVVRGDELSIEMRDTAERTTFAVHPRPDGLGSPGAAGPSRCEQRNVDLRRNRAVLSRPARHRSSATGIVARRPLDVARRPQCLRRQQAGVCQSRRAE